MLPRLCTISCLVCLLAAGGCGWVYKKPYRNDPLLQSRPPIVGEKLPPQFIPETVGEPMAPRRPL